jgi:hypothetical protein
MDLQMTREVARDVVVVVESPMSGFLPDPYCLEWSPALRMVLGRADEEWGWLWKAQYRASKIEERESAGAP